jgi:hypothetical protein
MNPQLLHDNWFENDQAKLKVPSRDFIARIYESTRSRAYSKTTVRKEWNEGRQERDVEQSGSECGDRCKKIFNDLT